MAESLDQLLNAEFKEAFDEFDKVSNTHTKILCSCQNTRVFSLQKVVCRQTVLRLKQFDVREARLGIF